MKNVNFTQGEKDGFVYIPKGVLKSKNISLKALGVYFLICSLPDDWNFSVKGLCTLCSDGKASVASAVTELEKAGFIKRTGMAHHDGKYATGDWIIRDKSKSESNAVEKPNAEKQLTENQFTENQPTENQLTEKQPQLNNKQLN
ncbi:MAG: helix-turn-helix domain-containing protein, partial [Clostridia bacterium]|nr:helix-turn-helix domain-containing protein [Clostridia bacterium]